MLFISRLKQIVVSVLFFCFFVANVQAEMPLIATYKATIVDLKTKMTPVYEELDDPPYSRYGYDLKEFDVYLDDGRVHNCYHYHLFPNYSTDYHKNSHLIEFPDYFVIGETVTVKLYSKMNYYLASTLTFSNGQSHHFWPGGDPYYDTMSASKVMQVKTITGRKGLKEFYILLEDGRELKGISKEIPEVPEWITIGQRVGVYTFVNQKNIPITVLTYENYPVPYKGTYGQPILYPLYQVNPKKG